MTPPQPLPKKPWREGIRRIVAGIAGVVLMGAAVVDFLGGGLSGRAAEHQHQGWVTVVVMAMGFILFVLALDFENRVLGIIGGIAKAVPLPWGRKE